MFETDLNDIIQISTIIIIIFLIFYIKKNESFAITDTTTDNITQLVNNKIKSIYGSELLKINKLGKIAEEFSTPSDKYLLDKINIQMEKNVNINNYMISQYKTNIFKIQNIDFNKLMFELIYPVGSFYIQYPNNNSNNLNIAFPNEYTPNVLFGGTWELRWNRESIYFRTEAEDNDDGVNISNDERTDEGIQLDAYKRLVGNLPTIQIDQMRTFGPQGTFKDLNKQSNNTWETGEGDDWTIRYEFDSGKQSLSSGETRVKNRLFRIWKKVSNL